MGYLATHGSMGWVSCGSMSPCPQSPTLSRSRSFSDQRQYTASVDTQGGKSFGQHVRGVMPARAQPPNSKVPANPATTTPASHAPASHAPTSHPPASQPARSTYTALCPIRPQQGPTPSTAAAAAVVLGLDSNDRALFRPGGCLNGSFSHGALHPDVASLTARAISYHVRPEDVLSPPRTRR
jgi:hypothetical protein